jgi:hypothetical protein
MHNSREHNADVPTNFLTLSMVRPDSPRHGEPTHIDHYSAKHLGPPGPVSLSSHLSLRSSIDTSVGKPSMRPMVAGAENLAKSEQ